MENREESKLKSEMIWKILKKSKFNSEDMENMEEK
jgi:hypothetical protein